MKRRLFLPLLIVIALLSGIVLSSCGEKAAEGGTFIWNHNGGITQIGSIADNLGIAANRNTYPVFEPLFLSDEQEHIKPFLATDWDISSDGKTITIKLKKNIKFQDGTPFNAAAVKYNLEAFLAANLTGTSFLTNVVSYEIPDEYTLRINLEETDSTFLLRLTQGALGMMASPTAMAKTATAENMAQLHTVGTGPFVLDSWQRDSYVRYTKWGGYWQEGKPYLDAIEIRNIADLTVSIMSFKSGEVQAVENVDPVDARQLEAEGYTIYQPNLYFLHSIIPSASDPNSPFAIKKVREAVEYAIKKEEIAQGIGMGYYEALNQLATKKDPWYVDDIEPREYNPDKARQLLAEAGYEGGFHTTLISDVMARHDTLVAIQTYLREVGIETDLEILEFGAAFTKPQEGWEGILFPGFPNVGTLLGILGRYGDENNYVSFYRPPGWQDKWDAITAELDEGKRTELLKDIIRILQEEAICIPYQGDAPLVAMTNNLHGFEHHAMHIVSFWSPADVWIGEE